MKSSVRRTIIILIVLITLSACSQTAVPTETASPVPIAPTFPTPIFTQNPTPTPPTIPITYEPEAVPDYYPPLGFEVDSVWKAEPFGDEGGALLYMSKIIDGNCRLRVYMYQYAYEDSYLRSMVVKHFGADVIFDGANYRFSLEEFPTTYTDENGQLQEMERSNFYDVEDISGYLSLNGDSLSLIYTDVDVPDEFTQFCLSEDSPRIEYTAEWSDEVQYTLYFPENFEKAGESEAGQLMYAMPLQYGEIIVTEQVDQYAERYGSYTTSDPEQLPNARGVKIGDSLMSVLSRFMLEPEGLNELQEQEQGEYSVLYGGARSINAYAVLSYEAGKPLAMTYFAGGWITFYFDENLCVREVSYSIVW